MKIHGYISSAQTSYTEIDSYGDLHMASQKTLTTLVTYAASTEDGASSRIGRTKMRPEGQWH